MGNPKRTALFLIYSNSSLEFKDIRMAYSMQFVSLQVLVQCCKVQLANYFKHLLSPEMEMIFLVLLFYVSTSFTQDLFLNTLEFTNSKDPDGCDCVPFYLCKNHTIQTNGDGIIDIRFVLILFIFIRIIVCLDYSFVVIKD